MLYSARIPDVINVSIQRAKLKLILKESWAASPRECCGLLGGSFKYGKLHLSPYRTTNGSRRPGTFLIRSGKIESLKKEMRLRAEILCGCYHSHVVGPAFPSPTDQRMARHIGFVWVIYSTRERSINAFQWTGKQFCPLLLNITS